MTPKELRQQTDMTQKQFAEYFNIPQRTIEDWETEKRTCKQYMIELMYYKLEKEKKLKKE